MSSHRSTSTSAPQWNDGLGRAAIRSAQLLLCALLVALVAWAAIRLRLVVVPAAIALIITAAVLPLMHWLMNRGMPRTLAVATTLATGAAAVSALVAIIVVGVTGQAAQLASSAASGVRELERLATSTLPVGEHPLQRLRERATDALTSDAFRSSAVTGATMALELLAAALLSLFVLFFLLKDGPRIWGFFLQRADADSRPRIERAGHRSLHVLGGYVRGTAIIAFVDAVVIGAGLLLLDVPLALSLAVVVFLGAFVPLVGATFAGAVAALVALVGNGPITALIVVGLVLAVNQLEGNLLAPVVLGNALPLHPLAILLALTSGAILAGIVGALLAVPALAVVWTTITAWSGEGAGDQAPAPDR